jgi:hypothetical protein
MNILERIEVENDNVYYSEKMEEVLEIVLSFFDSPCPNDKYNEIAVLIDSLTTEKREFAFTSNVSSFGNMLITNFTRNKEFETKMDVDRFELSVSMGFYGGLPTLIQLWDGSVVNLIILN